MNEEKNERIQVNVDFTKFPDVYADLLALIETDDTDASKLIRRLIRQEKLRRAGQLPEQIALPLPTSKPTNKKSRTAEPHTANAPVAA